MSNLVNLILCEIYYHQNKHSESLFHSPPPTLIRPLTLNNPISLQFSDLLINPATGQSQSQYQFCNGNARILAHQLYNFLSTFQCTFQFTFSSLPR